MKKLLWLLCWIPWLGSATEPTKVTVAWGPEAGGLQLSAALSQGSRPRSSFVLVTFRNVGVQDEFLKLGTQTSGSQSPDRLGLTVIDAQGKVLEFRFVDRVYERAGGGVRSYIVPLAPEAQYELMMTLDQFWLADRSRNAADLRGVYQVTAHFQGCDRETADWCWNGELRSIPLQLQQ